MVATDPIVEPAAAIRFTGENRTFRLFGVILRIYIQRRIWKIVVSACGVLPVEHLATVAAAGRPASALGEGLADGLDVACF